jgi:hypothetical protein
MIYIVMVRTKAMTTHQPSIWMAETKRNVYLHLKVLNSLDRLYEAPIGALQSGKLITLALGSSSRARRTVVAALE